MSKAVPKLRFKEFKDNWTIRSLEEVTDTFKSGESITSKDIFDFGEYPVYGGNGLRGYTNSFTHDGFYVLIGRQGALCGNINRVKGKTYISEHAIAVQSNSLSDTEWLAQKLDVMKLNKLSESSAQPGLAVGKLLKLKYFFPSLPEQQKIASFLSAVDERIQQLTRKRELLEQYKKGVMQQLFSSSELGSRGLKDDRINPDHNNPSIHKSYKSQFRQLRFKDENGKAYPKWEEKRLGEVISTQSEKHNPQKETHSYRCIELEHLSSNTGMLLGYVDSSSSASIKNKFKKGDVLFGKLRPYLKKYLIAPFDGVCSSEIWVLSAKGITNEFLYRIIQTEYFIELANQSTGSKMPRAEWNVISSGVMKIPSLKEQQKIASFLTALDAKLESVVTQITHTQTFKKGLLQQMFV